MNKLMGLIFACIIAVTSAHSAAAADSFHVLVKRDTPHSDGGVPGRMFINGKYAGATLENGSYLIKSGTYKGFLRYASKNAFALSANGQLSKKGDFLLEIGNVPGKSHILFHTGNAPHHSKGCILVGPRHPEGLPDDHLLRKMRLVFYGTEHPSSSPNKIIKIEIVGP